MSYSARNRISSAIDPWECCWDLHKEIRNRVGKVLIANWSLSIQKQKIIKGPRSVAVVLGRHEDNVARLVELGIKEKLAYDLSEDEARSLLHAILLVRKKYGESG